MKTYNHDFLVFIGRFQPFHNGHKAVIEKGLAESQNIIIMCGSAHQPRSPRNPWSFREREQMIRSAIGEEFQERVFVAPLMDSPYNDEVWVQRVQSTVQGIVTAHHKIPHKPAKVGLIGHQKDASSYYLNLFPQWASVNVANVDGINATQIRQSIFGMDSIYEGLEYLQSKEAFNMIPQNVRDDLSRFTESDAYRAVEEEIGFVAKYQAAWENAPYSPTFVTVDAVVVQSGHVLMVERKAKPGKGLLALPGGFVDGDERIKDACIRELKEETKIKVPVPVLKGSIKKSDVFDDPYRSARGRTITHAFYIELEPSQALPKVKGGDDAKKAMWVPLCDLNPETIFEDHYFIIQDMIGR